MIKAFLSFRAGSLYARSMQNNETKKYKNCVNAKMKSFFKSGEKLF